MLPELRSKYRPSQDPGSHPTTSSMRLVFMTPLPPQAQALAPTVDSSSRWAVGWGQGSRVLRPWPGKQGGGGEAGPKMSWGSKPLHILGQPWRLPFQNTNPKTKLIRIARRCPQSIKPQRQSPRLSQVLGALSGGRAGPTVVHCFPSILNRSKAGAPVFLKFGALRLTWLPPKLPGQHCSLSRSWKLWWGGKHDSQLPGLPT